MAMILEVENLHVHYRTSRGDVRAVDGASFAVPAGAVVGLVGESGCGKTTAARAITGVMTRNASIPEGAIRFDGTDLTKLDARSYAALRWRAIAFVPQSAMNSLDPVYRVGKQIEEVLIVRGDSSRDAARKRAAELFDLVGLDPHRLRDYPHQFSGGMRQRAAIALALALSPKLVIADEPVTALDVIVQRQVLDVVRDLQQRLSLSMILVTHDISVVAYVCDQVVVMYAGQVVETGPTGAVLEFPAHPYTMGLTNAFPDLARSGGQLTAIDGDPPDLLTPPAGCRFAARCPFALALCHVETPPRTRVADGHHASCWRIEEAATLRTRALEVATWQRS